MRGLETTLRSPEQAEERVGKEKLFLADFLNNPITRDIAKVMLLITAFTAGAARPEFSHAQEATDENHLESIESNKETIQALEQMMANPEYKHRTGDFLYSTPFIRVEHSKEGLIRVIKKGVRDGDYDTRLVSFFIRDGELESYDRPEQTAVRLEAADLENPFIQYLLEEGFITRDNTSTNEPQLAQEIDQIEPVSPDKKTILPREEFEIDQTAGQGTFVVGQEGELLATFGLGPCVGITVFDPESRHGGVLHLDPVQKADQSLDAMISELNIEDSSRLQVQMVGGWSGMSERNIYYLRQAIDRLGAQITGEDVLGYDIARNIVLDLSTGQVTLVE